MLSSQNFRKQAVSDEVLELSFALQAKMLLCRNYMESEHIEESLRALLPKDDSKAVEKPAEAALRLRM